MKCVKCKKEFNPREDCNVKEAGGYGETTELNIRCPHCNVLYAHWVEPSEWYIQET